MRTYLKIASPWSQLAIFLGLLLACYLFTLSAASAILYSKGLVLNTQGGKTGFDFSNPGVVSILKAIQGFSSVGIFLLPALLFAQITFRYQPYWFLGFHPADKRIFYILAVALAIFSFPMTGWLGELNQRISLPASLASLETDADQQLEAFLKAGSVGELFYNLFIIALLPAVCEEACFRGGLQRVLIHAFRNPWAGIIISAIIFSSFHMQFAGFLPRLFLGILLGAIYWYSGSLLPGILAHFVINGVQVVAAMYYPRLVHENPSVPVYAALVSGLLVALLMASLVRQSGMSYAKVYETGEEGSINH